MVAQKTFTVEFDLNGTWKRSADFPGDYQWPEYKAMARHVRNRERCYRNPIHYRFVIRTVEVVGIVPVRRRKK